MASANNARKFGQIFVPETFLTGLPKLVDYHPDSELVKDKLKKVIQKATGEIPERIVYEGLKEYFKKMGEDVLVIHSMYFLEWNLEKRQKKSAGEKDFIIINRTHQYIMNLEVKNLLGTQGSVSSLAKAKAQIEGTKALIESWFGADLSSDWRFIGALFTNKVEQDLCFCKQCSSFIMVGQSQIYEKLQRITQMLKDERPSFSVASADEFQTLVKYLLFCAHANQSPVPSTFSRVLQFS